MHIDDYLEQNRKNIRDELLRHLQNLIRIDTRSHLRHESRAAAYLREQLSASDISSVLLEPIAGKGSVIASLPGPSGVPPLLLLSHLDTDDWDENGWEHHPLSGEMADGFIWGRGAVDCKGLTAIWLTTLRLVKGLGFPLRRKLLIVSTADEEAGGAWGAKWLTEKTDLIPADAWILSEGGGFPVNFGRRQYFVCQTGETGLIEFEPSVLDKIKGLLRQEYPPVSRRTNREFARRIFERQPLPARLSILFPRTWEKTLNFLQSGKRYRLDLSMLFRPLLLEDSIASPLLRARIAPLSDAPGKLSDALRKAKARIIQLPTESPAGHEVFRVIEKVVAKNSGAPVVPYVTPGMSDNRFFRARGNPVFGFYPLGQINTFRTIHASNEKVSADDLFEAFLLLFQIVLGLVLPEDT